MQALLPAPAVPISEIKSFGPFDRPNEVSDGDWWIEIQFVKTVKKAEYSPPTSTAIRTVTNPSFQSQCPPHRTNNR